MASNSVATRDGASVVSLTQPHESFDALLAAIPNNSILSKIESIPGRASQSPSPKFTDIVLRLALGGPACHIRYA